ncbi:MAG: pantoate kinase [Methanocorpusculum sp.]|uniref:pantoate kinase n=1 Tax=Methanocorpusculum sp. TaxID=2058474 RepID=UPI00271CC1F8|nr:pantoate kinase [Methanocorpusculum sp.]MDO9523846.1 pantoate kinase [Methanocorpusculum sp.]
MGRSCITFAPGHISGYFKRIDGISVQTTGSLGAGIVIDKGVTVEMHEACKTRIQIGDDHTDDWLIREVLSSLDVTADVRVTVDMPIGAGFGMSAAGLLAAYSAANCVFGLGLTPEDIAAAAHEVEVAHGTGLGDVAAATGGGLVVRTHPGISGVTTRFYPEEEFWTISFGGISTHDVITSHEKMQQVAAAFPEREPTSLAEFMENSASFTEKSGLMPPDLIPVLAACKAAGIPASMTMLGNGVFAVGPAAENVLKQFGEPILLHVSRSGPVILEENHV